MAAAQTPAIILQALARPVRRHRRRSRAPLALIALPPSYQPDPPPSPPPGAYNNYLSTPPRTAKPSGAAKRKAGAPLGNRNAALKRSAHWLAFEAKYRDFMDRAKMAIARAEAEIAVQSRPPRRILHITVIRDGVVVRQREILLSPAAPRFATPPPAAPPQTPPRPITPTSSTPRSVTRLGKSNRRSGTGGLRPALCSPQQRRSGSCGTDEKRQRSPGRYWCSWRWHAPPWPGRPSLPMILRPPHAFTF